MDNGEFYTLVEKLVKKQDYLKVCEMYDTDPSLFRENSLFYLIYSLYRLQKFDKAILILEQNSRRDSLQESQKWFQIAGELYFRTGEYRKSISALSKSKKLCKTSEQTKRADYFLNALKEKIADKALDHSLESEKIETIFKNKDFAQCIDILGKKDSDNLTLLEIEILALSLFQTKRFEDSAELFEFLCHIDPMKGQHFYHHALCLIEINKITQACIELKKSIQINPLHQKSWFALYEIYKNGGLKEEAIKIKNEILIINPFSEVARRLILEYNF